MPEESKPKKRTKKKAPAKTICECAERGDVLVVIGKADKLKAAPGVQVVHLDGEEVTQGGDRYSIAHISSAGMYDLGWIRRK